MACSVPRRVGATYKALWTKVKANAAAGAAGRIRKRYQGPVQQRKQVSLTLTYPLGHDYAFKTEQRVSLLTLAGRVIVPYAGYAARGSHPAWRLSWGRPSCGRTNRRQRC